MSLDEQIAQTFSVASLLLAVAGAYLGAIWPVISDLLGPQAPEDDFQRRVLTNRRRTYAASAVVLTVFEAAVVVILIPLVAEVVGQWDSGGDFRPVRAGLLLAVLSLGAGAFLTGNLAARLWRDKD